MAYPPPPPRRPIGVAILAILIILAGLVLTLIAIVGLALGGLALIAIPGVGAILFALAVVFFILSLILLLAGIGLWRMRPWAWWLAVIVLFLGIVRSLALVGISGLSNLSAGEAIALGIPILILIYLFAVRGHFRSPVVYAQ